jgi:hypothetical protein
MRNGLAMASVITEIYGSAIVSSNPFFSSQMSSPLLLAELTIVSALEVVRYP